jgi:antitoxin component of RelBE/YafQ-DinJ toxin-antitoxin module
MKPRDAVVDRQEQATLPESSLTAVIAPFGYIERLKQAGLFPSINTYNITAQELGEIVSRLLEENHGSRIVFFDSLAEQGLLPKPGELSGEQLKQFIFMQPKDESGWRKRLNKRTVPESQEPSAETREPDTTPVSPRAPVRLRKTYVSPSREGKATITVHVDPELKENVLKVAEQSNLTFNEFITALLKRSVDSPAQQSDETLHLSEDALQKTREAEKAIRRLTVTLSGHSR